MKTIATVIMAIVVCAAQVWAGSVGDAVEVCIVSDEGRALPTYPVKTRHSIKKVYAEAIKGDHYRIEVKNRLNRRVGVVIAVDGRNIVSGDKSWLKNSERMYILEPYGTGEFSGWRSSVNRINRFYFTDVPDSYAAAFGDESAMGVISVAAYAEVRHYRPPPPPLSQSDQSHGNRYEGKQAADRAAPAAPAGETSRNLAAKAENKSLESAGTGYGHEEYSPVQIVAFEPESRALETIHFKYEWRTTLCKMGVIRCDLPHRRPPNRLWDNSGYAPPPPGRS
ncbi:MAG: hypothetical protein M0023_06730 [Desulfobacteraceae bacterium]|nr:hypothetical protein [Desulfobacteraceae bacterium]